MTPDERERTAVVVTNKHAEQRYEAEVDGALAILTYERQGDRIAYLHVGVPLALSARGVGSALVRTALEDARAERLTVAPLCPFVAAYIRRHQDYLTLVAEAERPRYRRG